MRSTYHVLGMMSGSSLDGLDLALCRFDLDRAAANPIADWSILRAATLPFNRQWKDRLQELPGASAGMLAEAHAAFGRYLAELARPFLATCEPLPDLLASHGHTLFHDPTRGYTFQLGDGAALSAKTGIPVASDFRTQDIALGGQGAPLAPLADRLLFPGYDFYLNLGGIANISAPLPDGSIIAFDIGGANQVLNRLVEPLDIPFDKGGRLAAAGELDEALLRKVDSLPYFEAPYPKSLGNAWVRETLLPLYLSATTSLADKLHSACVQLAGQVARAIRQIREREGLWKPAFRMLVTGGGAFNGFLVARIEEACREQMALELVVPDAELVSFKEAALMALMGVLRLEGLPNCLSSATGATKDSVGGALHHVAA